MPEFTKRKTKKKLKPISADWKIRYNDAHKDWFRQQYASAHADGHYKEPKYPNVRKTNGITSVVNEYLTWKGFYCNRINTMGKQVKDKFGNSKWLPSMTKKGTADLDILINGRSIKAEIKNKYTGDKQSDDQVKEQKRVTDAGGIYIVITCVEDFFIWFDNFILT